jgi:hypothetical protein
VVVRDDGAFSQGVVVELQRLRTALIVALVLDSASLADELSTPGGSGHGGSWFSGGLSRDD